MKSVKRYSALVTMVLLVFALFPIPALAEIEPIDGEEFILIDENSGYKIIVPNYIEIKSVEVYDEFLEETYEVSGVIVVEMPEQDSEGNSLIYQVITTDEQASHLESYPGTVEQLGMVAGDIVDGKFNYIVDFGLEENQVYRLNFSTDSGFWVTDVNFMFVSSADEAAAEETAESAEATEPEASVPEATQPAAELSNGEILLGDENSGYKIFVPTFVEKSTTYTYHGFTGERVEHDLIMMEMPEQNSDGSYSIFQLNTTDSEATSLESTFADEYIILGWTSGQIVDGKFDYTVKIDEQYEGIEIVEDFSYFVNLSTDSGFNADFAVMFVTPEESETADAAQDEASSEQAESVSAAPTSSTVLVNGEEVAFDAYVINSNNYFKLRDLAAVVSGTEKQFEVGWDGTNNTITLESGKPYTTVGGELDVSDSRTELQVRANTSAIIIDGTEVELTAYTINGNNYFKLRDIAQAFNIGVDWDGSTNTVIIDTSKDYIVE